MRSIIKSIVVGAILALGFSTAMATAAGNPFIGTWKLSTAKSTSTGTDPWPTSETRVFSESDQGVMLTTKTVAADGKESTVGGNSTKWDGVPHAISGDPVADMVAVKRLGERMLEYTLTKAGKTVDRGTAVVSNDGKTLAFYGRAAGPKGAPVYYHEVCDRN